MVCDKRKRYLYKRWERNVRDTIEMQKRDGSVGPHWLEVDATVGMLVTLPEMYSTRMRGWEQMK